MVGMFLVTSTYQASNEAIQHRLESHRAWLDTHYETGTFFISGRLVPPTGGFMLARGIGRHAAFGYGMLLLSPLGRDR